MRAGMCAYLIYEKWFCSASLACHEQTERRSHIMWRWKYGMILVRLKGRLNASSLRLISLTLCIPWQMMVLHTFFMLGGHRYIRTERKCLFIFVDFYILLYFVNIMLESPSVITMKSMTLKISNVKSACLCLCSLSLWIGITPTQLPSPILPPLPFSINVWFCEIRLDFLMLKLIAVVAFLVWLLLFMFL